MRTKMYNGYVTPENRIKVYSSGDILTITTITGNELIIEDDDKQCYCLPYQNGYKGVLVPIKENFDDLK